MWNEIEKILEDKAKEGVEVHLMYDDIGCMGKVPVNFYKYLRDKGLPRHAGLFENAVLLRRGGDDAVAAMDSMWWDCLQKLSGRDQLSLVYCARECGVEIAPLFPEGCKLRDCAYLDYVFHDRVPARPWLVKKWLDARRRVAKWLLQREIDRV